MYFAMFVWRMHVMFTCMTTCFSIEVEPTVPCDAAPINQWRLSSHLSASSKALHSDCRTQGDLVGGVLFRHLAGPVAPSAKIKRIQVWALGRLLHDPTEQRSTQQNAPRRTKSWLRAMSQHCCRQPWFVYIWTVYTLRLPVYVLYIYIMMRGPRSPLLGKGRARPVLPPLPPRSGQGPPGTLSSPRYGIKPLFSTSEEGTAVLCE